MAANEIARFLACWGTSVSRGASLCSDFREHLDVSAFDKNTPMTLVWRWFPLTLACFTVVCASSGRRMFLCEIL